jgi:hypothetical protein
MFMVLPVIDWLVQWPTKKGYDEPIVSAAAQRAPERRMLFVLLTPKSTD